MHGGRAQVRSHRGGMQARLYSMAIPHAGEPMLRASLFVAAITLGAVAVHAADTDPYTRQIEQWRADRVAKLTAPDGWLSLIGLEWLHEGANRIGSAADNDIVLKAGPAHLGTIMLAADGSLRIALDHAAGATIDGKSLSEAARSEER